MSDAERTRQREWAERESTAEAMVPIIGTLHRDGGVVASLHGRPLVGRGTIDLIKAHRYARRVADGEVALRDTLTLLRKLSTLELGPCSIDVAEALLDQRASGLTMDAYLRAELADHIGGHGGSTPTTDVVLYGFGRIGRLVARILLAHQGKASPLRLRAIVVRGTGPRELERRASLLRRDSVHGPFAGTITVDAARAVLIANGTEIQVIDAAEPDQIDYRRHGIERAILVDNTGRSRDRPALERHLAAPGIATVLLTAPAGGDVPNVVAGVNDADADGQRVVAAASCTTNAVTPVLAALHRRFGVERGHIETVHSFTNDQNLTDNHHRADRRGRSAPLNLVLTETGAARAVGKALPELAGRLTGSAIRVPTPNVSIAVMTLHLKQPADRDALNDHLRSVALRSPLRAQVDYVESPEIASTDLVGAQHAGIVDGTATIADGNDVVVYVWYDNECGYSHQVVRLLERLAGATPSAHPTGALSRRSAAPAFVG